MKIRILTGVAVVAATVFAQPVCAQNATSPKTAWKKQVVRMVDIKQPGADKPHRLKSAGIDSSLAETFITAIRSGKLAAYNSTDFSMNNMLQARMLDDVLGTRPDTIIIVDPVDGKERMQIVRREFNGDSLTLYRIQEDWTFYPGTGKTDIQITGIAPIMKIYGDAGDFRGVRALFWLNYQDVQSILARYEQYHPNNTIAHKIWEDYFLSDTRPEVVK